MATTGRNPLLGFSIAAAILAAVGAFVVFTALRFIRDSRWVAQTSAVMTQVDEIARLERAAIAVQRGYVLLGADALRTEFWEEKAKVPQELRNLDAMVQEKTVADRLDTLEPKILRRLAMAAKAVAVYDRKGLQATQEHIRNNGGLELDREIRNLFDDIGAQQSRLLKEYSQVSESSAALLLVAAIGGIPLSLIILAAVYRILIRENAERRRLEQSATESATGLRKLSGDMEAMSKYAGMLQSSDGAAELLALTRQALIRLAPTLACTVYLLRASKDHAEIAMQWGEHAASSDAMPLPTDCWAVRRNQLFACNDVRSDIACAHVKSSQAESSVATACLPLSAQGELMGWLYLSGPGPGPLPELDLILQAAEQFSLALANIRLREDLRNQSIRDPLTGLFNRRYLEESMAREISRCQRRKLPLVVLMLDLDAFKAFNDNYGHPGGDSLLSAFGRLLQASCRPEDIACRYGGEEFTVILAEADKDIGMQRAKSIIAAAAQMVVSHQGVPLGRITTSVGMAYLPEHGTTSTALLGAADKALYQAKADGRNRVCVAVPQSRIDALEGIQNEIPDSPSI